MEGPEGNTNNNEAGLSIEQDHAYVLPSAHAIGHDSWQQVGLMLVTSFNCGYILSFSNLMLVPLGWTWGIICLVVVGIYTALLSIFAAHSFLLTRGSMIVFWFRHCSTYKETKDSWQQVGLMLVTSFNCGYILSFSYLQLVPLGWTWGIICLLFFGAYTLYAHWLMAGFHIINGQRFIRFIDLMGYTCGRKMYYVTFYLQYLVIILTNMGFILLGGSALKAINMEFSENPWRLQYFIVLTGATYFIFAFCVPTMSHMGIWLIPSTIVTFLYIITLLVVVINDGKNNTDRNYQVPKDKEERVVRAFCAISAIVVSSSSGLLPEIQSTLKKPEVANMRKALYMQYSVGILFYYGVSIAGYWAYGSGVSDYLPDQLSGPRWVKVLINAAVFLQAIVSQHTFIMPIHEALDTASLQLDKSINSLENLKRRFYLRFLLFAGTTFVTAAIPFMADFVALFGALAIIPLTLVFPNLVFIRVKGKTARLGENLWHWFNIIVFSLLALAATVAAVYQIVNSVELYSFFADG